MKLYHREVDKRLRRKIEPKEELYIPLMDMDLSFEHHEVSITKATWDGGGSVYEIAEQLRRDPDEITVLIMDLARRGEIDIRSGGVIGIRTIGKRTSSTTAKEASA